jgi:hypothetical protein
MTARRLPFRAQDLAPVPALAGGTRFRLFAVYAEGMIPETVELPLPPGHIGPGPCDSALQVVDAADKPAPYDPPSYAPPYQGRRLPPALPDAQGHFDHLDVDTPQFLAAHLYGSMRHALEIWQRYLGRRVVWWHADRYPRMELIPLLDWQNAQSGPGFMETGLYCGSDGTVQPFALNFDVIAHETGHQILFSQIGVPDEDGVGVPFLAFHESFSDLVALVAVMHFPSVLARLLEQTQGNLYVLNLVNRIGETSAHTQIRLASNTATMAAVRDIALAPDGSWIDPSGRGRNQHAVAEPLTGAIFDILVEIYQDTLVVEGMIAPEADVRGWTRDEVDAAFTGVQTHSARALARFRHGFTVAIRHARDSVGRAMAHVIHTVEPDGLTFDEVAARFIEGLLEQGNGAILEAMLDHFLWRGIDPRRFLKFVPATPQRLRRGTTLFRVAPVPRRESCTCHPGGIRRASELIRASHAVHRG